MHIKTGCTDPRKQTSNK